MLLMDLFSVPIKTLISPIRLSKHNKTVSKSFVFTESMIQIMTNTPECRIEIRSMRLGTECFKNAYPNFSQFEVSPGQFKKNFELPEREQSRKRKDYPMDITKYVKVVPNKKYALKMNFLKNFTKLDKNSDDNVYVIGLYLIFPINPAKIIEFF
jgi:hypothetical protein